MKITGSVVASVGSGARRGARAGHERARRVWDRPFRALPAKLPPRREKIPGVSRTRGRSSSSLRLRCNFSADVPRALKTGGSRRFRLVRRHTSPRVVGSASARRGFVGSGPSSGDVRRVRRLAIARAARRRRRHVALGRPRRRPPRRARGSRLGSRRRRVGRRRVVQHRDPRPPGGARVRVLRHRRRAVRGALRRLRTVVLQLAAQLLTRVVRGVPSHPIAMQGGAAPPRLPPRRDGPRVLPEREQERLHARVRPVRGRGGGRVARPRRRHRPRERARSRAEGPRPRPRPVAAPRRRQAVPPLARRRTRLRAVRERPPRHRLDGERARGAVEDEPGRVHVGRGDGRGGRVVVVRRGAPARGAALRRRVSVPERLRAADQTRGGLRQGTARVAEQGRRERAVGRRPERAQGGVFSVLERRGLDAVSRRRRVATAPRGRRPRKQRLVVGVVRRRPGGEVHRERGGWGGAEEPGRANRAHGRPRLVQRGFPLEVHRVRPGATGAARVRA